MKRIHVVTGALSICGLLSPIFLSGCAATLDEVQQPWTLSSSLPLPDGARMENPGSEPATNVLTSGLRGSLRPE